MDHHRGGRPSGCELDRRRRSAAVWRSPPECTGQPLGAEVPWQTLVYGLVRREVDEQVILELMHDPEGWELRVSCLPLETHAAHAAGAGGVALFAAAVLLIVGWPGGLLPAFATALAGGLWADWVRVVAMQRLEQRLRDLTESVGLALWPDSPATLLPPPTRPRI